MFPFIFLVLSFLIPVIFIFFLKKKYHFSFKPLLFGAITWIVFSQILEKILHVVILTQTPLLGYPILFGLYGALAAGIFEETGRLVAFKLFLPKFRRWKDGLSYGLGHGGVEFVIIGVMLGAMTVAIGQMSATELAELKKQLATSGLLDIMTQQHNPSYWLMGISERIMALFLQIALSLVVLYSITVKKYRYFLLAILLHALFDIPASFYQQQFISLPLVEVIIAIFGLLSLIFIVKAKRLFSESS